MHSALRSFRRGISLLEVLLSMFVLLFGLMGVAAIFPVGHHYVVEGEKFDQGSTLAQNAFEELRARGILRPQFWLYASNELSSDSKAPNDEFIQPIVHVGPTDPGIFSVLTSTDPGPGHAFVIDPLGAANTDEIHFPFSAHSLNPDNNPWINAAVPLAGDIWPVRRLTLPATSMTNPMNGPIAETIFRLRDDLSVEQPEKDDSPSIQLWKDDGAGALLARQYVGNYSWLVSVVPTTIDQSGVPVEQSLLALQPANSGYGSYDYDVSVVVFRKRDTTPSLDSERLIEAEILNDGEMAIYSTTSTADEEVDAALEDIRPGNWIAVMGVNQTTGAFIMKWYRLLALDDENSDVTLADTSTPRGRYAMLAGPDWPENSFENLRAVILPGAITVVTRQMKMEDRSLWSEN